MQWNVKFKNKKAEKQAQQLNKKVLSILQVLVDNLKTYGPAPGKHWHNYGKLEGKRQVDKRQSNLRMLLGSLQV